MDLRVRPMTADDAALVAGWRYVDKASVYNLDSPRPLLEELDCFHAVTDAGTLIGFCCAGKAARVAGMCEEPDTLDIGMGMDPALMGRGHGAAFGRAVLRYLTSRHPGQALRAVVQDWNQRSLQLTRRLGFADAGELIVRQNGRPVRYRVVVKSSKPSSL